MSSRTRRASTLAATRESHATAQRRKRDGSISARKRVKREERDEKEREEKCQDKINGNENRGEVKAHHQVWDEKEQTIETHVQQQQQQHHHYEEKEEVEEGEVIMVEEEKKAPLRRSTRVIPKSTSTSTSTSTSSKSTSRKSKLTSDFIITPQPSFYRPSNNIFSLTHRGWSSHHMSYPIPSTSRSWDTWHVTSCHTMFEHTHDRGYVMAIHPSRPVCVAGSKGGHVSVWNYGSVVNDRFIEETEANLPMSTLIHNPSSRPSQRCTGIVLDRNKGNRCWSSGFDGYVWQMEMDADHFGEATSFLECMDDVGFHTVDMGYGITQHLIAAGDTAGMMHVKDMRSRETEIYQLHKKKLGSLLFHPHDDHYFITTGNIHTIDASHARHTCFQRGTRGGKASGRGKKSKTSKKIEEEESDDTDSKQPHQYLPKRMDIHNSPVICMWDVRMLGGKKQYPIDVVEMNNVVTNIAISANGSHLLATSRDDHIYIFNLSRSSFELHTFFDDLPSTSKKISTSTSTSTSTCTSTASHPAPIISCPAYRSIEHDNNTGIWISDFTPTFHPHDDDLFVTGSLRTHEASLYSVRSGKKVHAFTDDSLRSVCSLTQFDPTGTALLGMAYGKMYLWNAYHLED